MSATSGIGVSPDLADKFAAAIESKTTRFLKVSIINEQLVHDLSIPVEGSLEEDLLKLQDDQILEDTVPTNLLIRLDNPAEWLAVYYVPDSAKIRDKMLYASTRTSLLKSLGSTFFTDSIFATSKSDLTPEGYAAHLKHMAAPQPLSVREQEMADVRAAERAAGSGGYVSSRARQSPIGAGVGLNWSEEVESAVKDLGEGEDSKVVIITVDPATETLVLDSVKETTVGELASALPPSSPCYAFFAWPHTHTSPPRRDLVFIYSCPSSSPIKTRMVYSSGSSSTFVTAKNLLSTSTSTLATRKIETSDPTELDEGYLRSELGLDIGGDAPVEEEKKPFARPKGPGRRR